MLRVEALVTRAGRAPLSFDVARGRCVGLLGTNAEDVSRVLLAAATLSRPVSGRVMIDDIDTVREPDSVRRRVAVTRPRCVNDRLRLREYLDTVARAPIHGHHAARVGRRDPAALGTRRRTHAHVPGRARRSGAGGLAHAVDRSRRPQ